MFLLDCTGAHVALKSINADSLKFVADCYNSTRDSVYATGLELPVTNNIMNIKYAEAAVSRDEIFAGVYLTGTQEITGVLRAGIREFDRVLWINSIVIVPWNRRKGYGSEALELLMREVCKKRRIDKVCLTVLERNAAGREFWLKNGFSEARTVTRDYGGEGRHNVMVMYRNTHAMV